MLADKVRERDEIISRKLFQATDDGERDRYLAGRAEITAGQRAADELAAVVGDPETVCDERGWLPAERRELSLTLFRVRRVADVRELRARVPARQAELKAMRGRAGRAELCEALQMDMARLASLEAMPPMQAAGCALNAPTRPGIRRALRSTSPTAVPPAVRVRHGRDGRRRSRCCAPSCAR